MRIGMVSTLPPEKCGIAIYSDCLIRALKTAGIEVITIGTMDSKADYRLKFESPNLSKNLMEITIKEKLELLHIQHNYPHFNKLLNNNLIKALKQNKPNVVTLHEVQSKNEKNIKRKLKNFIIKKIEGSIVKNATLTIVHTPLQKEIIRARHKSQNVECIFHGLSLSTKHKLNKGKKKVLLFGIVSEKKGVEYLIDAAKILKDFSFVIAGPIANGSENYAKMLRQMIKTNQLENVKLDLNWIEENKKWDYYKESDIVVLPYIWAPYQSGILHNAISFCLPLVVSRVGSLHEMVEKYNMGIVVEPKNPEQIALNIQKAFKNYQKYQSNMEKYRELANWSEIAKKTIKAYFDLVKKGTNSS